MDNMRPAPPKRRSVALIFFILTFFCSCLGKDEKILPPATGKSGDLLVVMDSSLWLGNTGKGAMKCFAQAQEGLPQGEPMFNVIKLTPDNFKQLFKTTRNIVMISKNKLSNEKKYLMKEDVWAKDQLVLMLLAEDDETTARIIEKNCKGLREAFNAHEIKRLQRAYEHLKDVSLTVDIREHFDIKPAIPADYKLAASTKDLVWLRKDFETNGHQISMGIIFYRRPYIAEADFETTHLMAVRDEITKVVEGPAEGSYMTHYAEYVPVTNEFNINGRYVKTLRGLWNMKNAFMGGPFIQVAFVDKTGTQLICIDGYVFSPGFDKREYLREVEAIALSALE